LDVKKSTVSGLVLVNENFDESFLNVAS